MAKRIGVYGTEGVGKTTFVSRFPGVIFIDTEGSTTHMDVARFDTPENLQQVRDEIQYVIDHAGDFGTLAIDTMDWLERLLFAEVIEDAQKNNKGIKNIEDFGYGKGYVYAKTKMQEILELLDQVIAKGVNVALVCHSMIRKFELPDEMGSYDRYMLKLNEKNIAPLVKEWVDALLFVNYRTDIIKDQDGKTSKGRGGQKRVMYANHNACWDAKNRFGLPDSLPFEFEQIAHLFGPAPEVAEAHIPDPEPKEKKPVEIQKPTAEVTMSNTVPGIGGKTRKTKAEEKPEVTSPERPESLRSEDKEKDKLLEKVWRNLLSIGVLDPLVLQAVVAEREYYDVTVTPKDYETNFISDMLIDCWDQVRKLVDSKVRDLPF